jgi:hypothetical protein
VKRHFAAILLVLGAGLLFQVWFLGLTPRGLEIGDASLSSAYTEALAHGQSYLRDAPDPQHPLLDTSLYHGRHYMYFGIVPFVAFMVPWLKATGAAPSPEAAIIVFSAVGYLAYAGILLLALRRGIRGVSAILSGAAFAAIVIASGTWPLMGRPAIYEIENAAAYAFLALSLLSLAAYELREARSVLPLALAAGFAALAMGCRPNYFPAVAAIACWVLFRSWAAAQGAPRRALRAIRTLLPMAVIGALLAYWNYHRFGDPFDFGLKHTVSEDPALARPLSSLSNVPYHLQRYTLGEPSLMRYFPFIQGQREAAFHLSSWQEVSNQVYGFLLLTPIVAAAVLVLLLPATNARRRLLAFSGVCAAAFFGNFLFLITVTQSCYRYPADFLGPLALVAALGWIAFQEVGTPGRVLANLACFSLVAWSLAAVTCQTFSTAQTTELFDQRRPEDFRAAARPFDRVVYAIEALTHDGPRALALDLVLPGDRFGSVEPLVVVGENGAQDFLYLDYVRPGLLQVGFESTGRGGLLSNQLKVDYALPHRVELRYGSFLPPDDHPLLAGFSPEERSLARSMITVLLDGSPVIDGWAKFHLPRGKFSIGASPFDAAFGSTFSGRILHVDHPLFPAKASPARWEKASYGPLVATVELLPMPSGVFDPLLSVGLPGQGAQLLVEHLDGDKVRFVWLTTDGQRTTGPPVAWPSHDPRSLEVRAGALLPPLASSLWQPKTTLEEKSRDKTSLRVLLGNEEVLRANVPLLDASPATVAAGRDTLFLSGGVMPGLSIPLNAVKRKAW